MMTLPDDFQFSQANLQDFVDCPRRFQLRYLMELRWPAAQAEPIGEYERRMELGRAYHRLVQQHVLGVPEERIGGTISDPELRSWWENTLAHRPIALYGGDSATATVWSERGIADAVAGYRLVAKYDVLIIEPGRRVVILDWKTSTARTPDRFLRERLQTRVYPFLVVRAGAHAHLEAAITPEQVEMVYWFPGVPDSPAHFRYSEAQYREDGIYLNALIERVAQMGADDFYLTTDERRCLYCPFRSYCDRGIQAGALEDVEEVFLLQEATDTVEFDFDQIAEIEF
ncbi:MAG: PD-(D/E)XK nuclease family protein [Anaerolineae bacterium]